MTLPATYYGIATSSNRDEYPGDFIDWGTVYCNSSAISPEDTWRTLSKNEWDYLLQHNKHGWATVNGIAGMVIAPDGFEVSFVLFVSDKPVGPVVSHGDLTSVRTPFQETGDVSRVGRVPLGRRPPFGVMTNS